MTLTKEDKELIKKLKFTTDLGGFGSGIGHHPCADTIRLENGTRFETCVTSNEGGYPHHVRRTDEFKEFLKLVKVRSRAGRLVFVKKKMEEEQ